MNQKAIRVQYLNPDPWVRLIGDTNETKVVLEGVNCTSLVDSGAQVSSITEQLAHTLELEIKPLRKLVRIEGVGGYSVPYLGYCEATLKIPEVAAFEQDCCFLVMPNSPYGERCPIIIGTLHIDEILRLSTPEELASMSVAWDRGNLGTRMRMGALQISKELNEFEGEVTLTRDVTIPANGYAHTSGRGSHPLNSKRVNIMTEPIEEGSFVERTSSYVKGNSKRVQIMFKNVSSSPVTIKKGSKVARYSPANRVPPKLAPKLPDPHLGLSPQQTERDSQPELSVKATRAPTKERLSKLFSKLDLKGINTWSDENQQKVKDLIVEYEQLFALDDLELGKTDLVKHKIELHNPKPFKERHRRIPPHQYEEIRKHLKEMIEIGAIRKSNSPWCSAIVLVKKKDGSLRFCIDLRRLNERTIKDSHSLPRIDDSLDFLNGACIFTSLDLKAGYWQVMMDEDSIPLTAFSAGPLGFYECVRMPFGLCNAPATFQRLMESCLGDLHLNWCIIYLDDIIIFSKTPEEHIERLRGVFEKLLKAGLKLKPSKCEFFKDQISYLGHVVSAKGIATDPKKIEAVRNWPVPKTVTQVRSFLGFTNYYRRFIKGYAKVAKPVNNLIQGENSKKKNKYKKVEWSSECQEAFEELKRLCTTTPVLAYADYKKWFKVSTDASEKGLGAALYQDQEDGTSRVIAYASRSLSKSERNYDAHKLEFLALKWSITERFHEYLYGGTLEVYTDNNPLTYILSSAKLDATGQRWVAALANYNIKKIYYKVGRLNTDADCLSRIPWELEEIQDQATFVKHLCLTASAPEWVPPGGVPIESCELKISSEFQFTKEDWKREQSWDPVIAGIIEFLKGKPWPSFDNVPCKERLKLYKRVRKDLVLRQGLLYRKTTSQKTGEELYQFAMPSSLCTGAVQRCHEDYGHMGVDRVHGLLTERFYWPQMKEMVRKVVKECVRCFCFKQPKEQEELHPITASYPMELIHMDFMTIGDVDRPKTNILVVTDHFTRYAQAYVTTNQTAATVARTVCDKFFSHYGWPEKILTDQGKSFENRLFRELCVMAEIQKIRTTAYHPQGNGACERFNRTLINMIGTLNQKKKAVWQSVVSTLALAYNSTISAATGYSPYFLMYGRLPKLPIDVEYNVAYEKDAKSHHKYVERLEKRLRWAYEKAQSYIEKETNRHKKYYDKKFKCATLKPGDLVVVRVRAFGADHKIADKWESQVYRVIQQLYNKPVYNIQNIDTLACRVVHRNYLFPLRLLKESQDEAVEEITQDYFTCDCRSCVVSEGRAM